MFFFSFRVVFCHFVFGYLQFFCQFRGNPGCTRRVSSFFERDCLRGRQCLEEFFGLCFDSIFRFYFWRCTLRGQSCRRVEIFCLLPLSLVFLQLFSPLRQFVRFFIVLCSTISLYPMPLDLGVLLQQGINLFGVGDQSPTAFCAEFARGRVGCPLVIIKEGDLGWETVRFAQEEQGSLHPRG